MRKIDEFYNYSGTLYTAYEDENIYAIYQGDDIIECGMSEYEMWDLRENLIKEVK